MNGDLTLNPFQTSTPVVQDFGTYTITFKLATSLHYDSRIYITLPANLQVDRTSSTAFSCSVQFGADVKQGNYCKLDTNLLVDMKPIFVSVAKNVVAGGTEVKVVIGSSTQKISNPVSAKECGDWKVSTFNIIGDKEWLVDTASATTTNLKFTATAGTITTGIVSIIKVAGAKNIASSESDTYKFDLTLPHSLPAFGKIVLKLPSSITIPSTAPVASSCFTYRPSSSSSRTQQFCSVQNGNTEVQITFQTGFTVNLTSREISIELQGFRNPRTTQETGTFIANSFDKDGTTPIDTMGIFNMKILMDDVPQVP